MKQGYQFTFFSNPSLDDSIREKARDYCLAYEASYFGENDLTIFPRCFKFYELNSDIDLPFVDGRKAWDIFYTHCRIEFPLVNIVVQPDPKPTQSEIKEAVGSGFNKSVSRTMGLPQPNYVKVLNLIKEKPEVLHHEVIRRRFIDILKEAKDFVDKKGAERCKYLLKDYLIPLNPGGKKIIPSTVRVRLAIDLTKRLAKHLSDKCKQEGDIGKEDLKRSDDAYKRVLRWAIDNHEPRIYNLPIDDLKTLILKPAEYVENLLQKELGISIKTLKK